jgi:hypothetical protein
MAADMFGSNGLEPTRSPWLCQGYNRQIKENKRKDFCLVLFSFACVKLGLKLYPGWSGEGIDARIAAGRKSPYAMVRDFR